MMLAEPLPVQIANTRTSAERDCIETHRQWRTWAAQHSAGLRRLSRALDAHGLASIRRVRDDVQDVLRTAATGDPSDGEAFARIVRLAHSRLTYDLSWKWSRLVLLPGELDPAEAISRHLARTTLDLLLSNQAGDLRACSGRKCLKVFLSSRPDRRWCDSNVCGNRARVRRHATLRG